MGVIIDAGACQGEWMDDRYDTTSQFYCFEPLPVHFKVLSASYNHTPNVILEQKAIGAFNGTADIFFGNSLPSSVYWEATIVPDKYNQRPDSTIPVVKLSDYWKQHINTSVEIFKMNIEGAEYDVFEDLLNAGIINEFHTILYQDHGVRGDKVIPSCRDKAYEIFPRLQKEFTGELLFIPHWGTNHSTDEVPDYLK